MKIKSAISRSKHNSHTSQRGGVLVEFALVSFVLYILLAGISEMGRMIFSAQLLQSATRFLARELSLVELPAQTTLEEAFEEPTVQDQIFDSDFLVVDLDDLGGLSLDEFFNTLPAGNQMLRPLMIFEQVSVEDTTRRLLRYPGALLSDPSTPTGLTVGIPMVTDRDLDGAETIRWVPVIEEVNSGDEPFQLSSPDRGLVALRLNYPFQAASLSGFQTDNALIIADDASVVEENAAPGELLASGEQAGTYAGSYGLGRQFALGRNLRPYRKLLSAQSFYRREIFQ